MYQLILGSFLLSVLHAAIPNHWLPLIAIGRSEKWSLRETLIATIFAGIAHVLGTIIIGVIVGYIGIKLSHEIEHLAHAVVPIMLIGLGSIYLIVDLFKRNRHHHHHHLDNVEIKTRSKWGIVMALSLAMFLSPCLELELYFFQAGILGWKGIAVVSLIYALVTVSFMVLLVFLGFTGIRRLKWHFLEHNSRLVTGGLLVLLGIVAFFTGHTHVH